MRESWNESQKIDEGGGLVFCSCSKFSRYNSSGNACFAGYVITFVRSYGVTIRAFAWIFREFWCLSPSEIVILFSDEVCFDGSFDYSWRLWDLEQLKEVLHQVKYSYSSLFELT